MSQRTEFSKDFSKNKQRIDELLQIDKSFDLLYRVVIIGGKKACFYFVDGFSIKLNRRKCRKQRMIF